MRKLISVLLVLFVSSTLLFSTGCGNSEKIKEAIGKGNKAMSEQQYDLAVTSYQEALKLDSKNVDAKSGLEKAQKAKDFKEYLEKVKPYMETSYMLSNKWNELKQKSAAGEISDYEVGVQIANVFLPEYRKLTDQIEEISLDVNKDYRIAHEELIKASNLSVQALSEILSAIQNSDYSKITSANKLMADGSIAERRYVQLLDYKAKEVGVNIENSIQLPKAPPAPPKNDPTINLAEFDKLKTGMTYEEATTIIGGVGKVITEAGNPGEKYYRVTYQFTGEGSPGANAVLMFNEGKISAKTQYGLQ